MQCADPLAYLELAIPAYMRFGVETWTSTGLPSCCGMVVARRPNCRPNSVRPSAPGYSVCWERIAHGLSTGLLRSPAASPQAAAQAIWATIHGLLALQLAYPDFAWV